MQLKHKDITISNNLEFATTKTQQLLGLMFHLPISNNYALIFAFKKPSNIFVHMLFVFFSLDIIFLNETLQIIGLFHLNPFINTAFMKNTSYVIEIKSRTIKNFNLQVGSQLQLK